MDHPSFTRLLEPAEDARASALYDDLIRGLSPIDQNPPALERVRILNEQGGLNWTDPAHLRALGIASGEDEVYLVSPRNPGCPRLAVSLPEMTRFVDSNDLLDVDVCDVIMGEWDEAVLELLAPSFVDEWTLVSATGAWVFSAWNAGDLSLVAGNADFIDGYAAVRSDAPSEVIEWMVGEGETAATEDPELSTIARLRKNIKHSDFEFTISDVRHYLARFYDDDALEYLWSAAEQIFRTDTRRGLNADERNFPTQAWPAVPVPRVPGTEVYEFLDSTMTTSGSADERLIRLMSRDRSIRSRLDEIWSESRPR